MKRFILLLLLICAPVLKAQKDTLKAALPEIVVSATRVPTSSIQLASSFTLFSHSEIVNSQKLNVIDLLREAPGLSVTQAGGMGTMSNVFIRGANPYHTLVILDGAVVNDPSTPSGAFDFSSLTTDNIERIEIVRGPQSTLYGSDAIAGIINIFTQRPAEGFKVRLNAETGSNNLYKGDLSALGSLGKLGYSLSYLKLKTDGVSAASSKYGNTEKDGFENNVFTANLNYSVLENITAGLIYRYTKSNGGLDQNEKLGDDPNFTMNFEENLVRGSVRGEFYKGKWEWEAGIANVRKITHIDDGKDTAHPDMSSTSFTNGTRTKLDWMNTLNLIENNKITIGFETETERANSNYFSESMWGPYNTEFAEQSLRTTGLFAQDQFSYAGRFFGTAGVRYDKNERFGGEFTFRIAPAYVINSTGTKLKATYGTGFKAPSLYYLFDPMYGNRDLKPEKSEGWDAGIEQFLFNYRLSLGVTYFRINFDDMFGMDKNYKTINVAKARTEGIEFTVYYNAEKFKVNANYTYTNAVDKSTGSAEYGLPLIRRPKHKAVLEIDYAPMADLNINSSVVYTGAREDKDFSAYPAARVTLPDYTLFNIAASYKISRFFSVNASLENVFDKYYEDVLYYGTLGRNFTVGVSINY